MDREVIFILIVIVVLLAVLGVTMWLLRGERRRDDQFVGTYVDGWATRYRLYDDGSAEVRTADGKKTTAYWSPVMKDDVPCLIIMRGREMTTFYAVGRRLHRYKADKASPNPS